MHRTAPDLVVIKSCIRNNTLNGLFLGMGLGVFQGMACFGGGFQGLFRD